MWEKSRLIDFVGVCIQDNLKAGMEEEEEEKKKDEELDRQVLLAEQRREEERLLQEERQREKLEKIKAVEGKMVTNIDGTQVAHCQDVVCV